MGCELNLKVPYTEFSLVTKKQKEILKLIIQKKQAEITEKVCKLCERNSIVRVANRLLMSLRRSLCLWTVSLSFVFMH